MSRIFGLFFLFLFFSCSPGKKLAKNLKRTEIKFQDHIGFMLYDPEKRKTLADFNAEKYFTPASNTKIFTFFSAIQLLGDSIPAFRYIEKPDSLIFWGTGDPSFLNRNTFQSTVAYDFLKNHSASLYFSTANFYQNYFGPGWAWDDYNSYYSAERSSFPIYSNCMTVTDSVNHEIKVSPRYFQDSIVSQPSIESGKRAIREISRNKIVFQADTSRKAYTKEIPFHVSPQLIASLLRDTLQREVRLIDTGMPEEGVRTLFSIPSDSLYKVMMQESDNFIAEQLLQLCALEISDSLKSQIAIDYVKKSFLFDLPDEPQWVDGSGLSRYNLFTPRSIVRLWEKIMHLVPRERLFELLAIGGKAGTTKNYYQAETPYIFGKTGTLSNNHCISGYLLTKKGKVLIFSFMNNNFTTSTREVRAMMEEKLFEIHEKF